MIEEQNNFSLPEDYFDNASKSIFNKIEWQEEHKEYPNLLKHRSFEVFGVPENYFDGSERKLEMLTYEKLTSLNRQNPFSVPANYFEENETRLFTSLKKEAKIISLFSRRNLYAAAAGLVVALGFWFYGSFFNPTQNIDDCNTLACLDKTDLLKLTELESLDSDDLYNMVDLEKLEQHLNIDTTTEDFE